MFTVLVHKSFTSQMKFILGYFTLLDATVNGIVLLVPFTGCCWCTEMQLVFVYSFWVLQHC